MNTPTYKEQFDKITEAYLNDKLEPYNDCACFIGNMLNKTDVWSDIRIGASFKGRGCLIVFSDDNRYRRGLTWIENLSNHLYTAQNILDLENNFLKVIYDYLEFDDSVVFSSDMAITHPNYENALFLAMESTLELLKEIHIKSGEIIDREFVFVKRVVEITV